MAKMNRGNMLDCLAKARHHLHGGGTWLEMAMISGNPGALFDYRLGIIREEVEEVIVRLRRIKEVAVQQENQAILNILEEEFEFGHDVTE